MASAITNGMKAKIDAAGRIVLPKEVRERFPLRAGTDLQLEQSPQGILLRPSEPIQGLVRRNGRLVHMGQLPAGYHWDALVEDDREERIKELSDL